MDYDSIANINNYIDVLPPVGDSPQLSYKPYTLRAADDGYVYINNKDNNSITRLDTTRLKTTTINWAVDGIVKPLYSILDEFGSLFVANAGTGPRNSRVSKIWINYFPFTQVTLPGNSDNVGTCSNAKVYDVTTNTFIPISWNPSDSSFPIPVPDQPNREVPTYTVKDTYNDRVVESYALFFYRLNQNGDEPGSP